MCDTVMRQSARDRSLNDDLPKIFVRWCLTEVEDGHSDHRLPSVADNFTVIIWQIFLRPAIAEIPKHVFHL